MYGTKPRGHGWHKPGVSGQALLTLAGAGTGTVPAPAPGAATPSRGYLPVCKSGWLRAKGKRPGLLLRTENHPAGNEIGFRCLLGARAPSQAQPPVQPVPRSVPAITSGAVGSGAVTSGAVGSGAVTSGAVTSGAVTSGTLTSGTLTSGTLTSGTLTSGTLTSGTLTSGTVTSGAVGSGTVTSGAEAAGCNAPARRGPDHHGPATLRPASPVLDCVQKLTAHPGDVNPGNCYFTYTRKGTSGTNNGSTITQGSQIRRL